MAFCANCGKKLEDDFEFCPECGHGVMDSSDDAYDNSFTHEDHVARMKKCDKCGEEMPEDAFYCLNCGYAFDEQFEDFGDIKQRLNQQIGIWKNKWIALFLCIFFGWLGAHRFYEGKMVTGVIYLFTLGCFGIGWIIDIIRISRKSNPYRAK